VYISISPVAKGGERLREGGGPGKGERKEERFSGKYFMYADYYVLI
jgi:hypothetical protein